MKIYVLCDLEGTAGVVDFEKQSYSDAKYNEQAKRLATLEINALVDGALAGGAKEIIVLDGHGSGGLDIEKVHIEAKVMMGRPISAPWEMDKSVDALFLYGHHAMANTEKGVLCHSWSSRTIANCWLNSELVGEIGFNMAIAGSLGIPTVFISGDEAAIAEARRYAPGIGSVIVKWGVSRTSAITLAPMKARQLIQEGATRAMSKIGSIPPVTINPPYEFKTEYLEEQSAESKAKRSDVERLDARTVRIVAETLIDLARRR
ncbi:MAG: M55 family metallopeptidase [Deltaproteobacteria bacterium]|nr:M55 family metallopeptidase [Deltaproteobacteria bacterium]